MKTLQKGFTLIELVVVIVILGILAATALPKFVDLRTDAQDAAFQGVRGAAASAMAINYAGCAAVNNSSGQATKCTKVSACSDVTKVMQGGLPTGYSVSVVSPDVDLTTTNGNTTNCTLALSGYAPPVSAAKTFLGISAGN